MSTGGGPATGRRPAGRGWDDPRGLRAGAIRYVQAAPRSAQEVRSYLLRRRAPRDLASRIVAECRSHGLLDDRASAALWTEQWSRRGYAWAVIRVKLSAKGFDEQTIETIGKTKACACDEEARARLVVQRVRGRSGPSTRVRLARRLSARGFDPDVIERLLGDPLTSLLSD